jgi:hypothetical protein
MAGAHFASMERTDEFKLKVNGKILEAEMDMMAEHAFKQVLGEIKKEIQREKRRGGVA